MRALLITDWMAGSGGAESYISWVREGLRAAGDEVSLLTSTAGTAGDGRADYRAYGTDRVAAQALLQIVNPFAVAQARRAVRAFRPQVVLVNMFEHHLSPAILAPLRGVPTVLTVTDYKCVCPIGSKLLPDGRRCTARAGAVCWRSGCVGLAHWLRDRPRYALIRSGLKGVDRVLACSDWVRRELAANDIAAEVLPLGVPAPGPDFRRTPARDPLFVYCGRFDVEKGVDLFLRAFARVRAGTPGACLRLVGRGPLRPMLDRLVGELGLDGAVTFRGWVPPAEVERELMDAWALVVPSRWAEPLGLVALEAITRGVPVIASADGGLGEAVEGGAGLLFPNGDEDALADRMLAIATGRAFPQRSLPDAVVRRARDTYDLGGHVRALRGILDDVARGPAPSPGRRAGLF
ncbi:MAG TPA: glycosyltransferase family 4 protein [Gemmatimonadales bacterium]